MDTVTPSVTVVTVTYGNRWHLLKQMLTRVQTNPQVERIIVVENGGDRSLSSGVEAAAFRHVSVLRNERNLGSACGFKLGLTAARRFAPTWIWILDDDNLPRDTALGAILQVAQTLGLQERDRCALAAFRPALQVDVALGVPIGRCYPPHSSFCGFHVADVPFKIWRRVRWQRVVKRALPALISVPYAPFGGLFFHSTLLDRIGTPNEALVLYADDTEFSHRIVKSGGHIWLIPGAVVEELDSSWSSRIQVRSSFERWLQRGSDFQVFYAARNRANFDSKVWNDSPTMYRINRLTYFGLMKLIATRRHRLDRYRLFRRAVWLGEHGRLGMSEDFPLH